MATKTGCPDDVLSELRELEQRSPCHWPDGTARRILVALRGSDAEARRVAIRFASHHLVFDAEIAAALLVLIRDGTVAVADRALACLALGPPLEMYSVCEWDHSLGPPPVSKAQLDEIRCGLHDVWLERSLPGIIRRAALESSARVPESWHRRAIVEVFALGCRAWRQTGIRCAGYVAGFGAEIVATLDSARADRQLMLAAVLAADRAQLRAAGPAVMSLASSPNTPRDVREAAIEALGRIDTPGRIAILRDLVARGDEELSDIASFALAQIHHFADESKWGHDPPST